MLIQLTQNITSNGAYYPSLRFKENLIQLIVLEKGQRRPKINGNGLLDWEAWHIITSEEYFSERAALLQGRRRTPAKISDRLVVQVCFRKIISLIEKIKTLLVWWMWHFFYVADPSYEGFIRTHHDGRGGACVEYWRRCWICRQWYLWRRCWIYSQQI